MKESGQVPPDPDANFELFDRVVNVRTLGVAPYGLKGTIVGIHKGLLCLSFARLQLIRFLEMKSSVFTCLFHPVLYLLSKMLGLFNTK